MAEKPRILIVDDDEAMTRTLGDILELVGHDVTAVHNGSEAVAMVERATFHCVLMDIRMPVMNGVEALKQIKKIAPECPVIMMTAYAVHDLIEEAKREGALAVVYKPIEPSRVVELVQKLRQESSVIIVDDDQSFCTTLCDVLQAKGYRIGAAFEGNEAIGLVEQGTYDFVILDMKLPDMDGLEVMDAIRDTNPDIAVILMSGYEEMEPSMEEGRKRSALATLRKPFDMDHVLRLLNDVWRQKLADAL